MKVGDGWRDPASSGPPRDVAGVRNADTINVNGDRSIGLFTGDETNTAANHNTWVENFEGARQENLRFVQAAPVEK